jgi:Capsule assembly protein Wzi
MFSRRWAVCVLAIGVVSLIARCSGAPPSSPDSSARSEKTQSPSAAAKPPEPPTYDPRHMGSTYVPLDSWIYPALDRLAAIGYAERGFEGMRPWTRMDCAGMIDRAKEALKELYPLTEGGEELLSRLEEEFSVEIGLQDGQRNLNATLDSIYARTVSISGPPLTDSYHFGQTISYDFGRPFERGTNGQAGGAFRAEAGPFAVYVRAEYQHSPSAPAPSQAVLDVIAFDDEVPLPADAGIAAINRPRVLDAYIVMRGVSKLSNWQLSVGRLSHSWGPGPGGAFLLSNNAEPVDMVEVVNPEPVRLPLFLKFLGPVRVDHFLGRLANRTDHANPWVYGHKISFKPLHCLEIGYGRLTTIGGRGGDPFTVQNFFLSSIGQVSQKLKSVPGENENEMDWTFYVPKTHNYVVFYGEVYAFDDFIAWVRPAAYPFRPGIYITRIPGIPKLDLHIEAANTQAPGWKSGSGGNTGNVVYWNFGYHEANTNNGLPMGNTVGRDGQTIQGWLTYWASPRNTFQLMYKNNFVDPAFIPGGGAWQDYSVQNEFHQRSGLYVKSQMQYEHISHYPLLFNGRQRNVTAIFELGFMPSRKKHEP